MRTTRLAAAAALALAAAACGQGDSDNMMSQRPNALSPQQVDFALGPETGNAAANQLEDGNELNTIEPVEADSRADMPTDNNSAEQ